MVWAGRRAVMIQEFWVKVKVTLWWLVVGLGVLLQLAGGAVRSDGDGGAVMAEPLRGGQRVVKQAYGDDVTVDALGALLGEGDPLTREAATRALGETDNGRALGYIVRAGRDDDATVRCAAVRAALEFESGEADEVILGALGDGVKGLLQALNYLNKSEKLTIVQNSDGELVIVE